MLATCSTTVAFSYPMPYTDEANKDSSLVRFRDELKRAAIKHDASFIRSNLSNDVLTAHGGGTGLRNFLERWDCNDTRSEFWTVLTTALSHGGHFYIENGVTQFDAPYPRFEMGETTEAAVVEKNVPMFSEPNVGSKILEHVSFESVEVADDRVVVERPTLEWVKVKVHCQTGFIEHKKLIVQTDPSITLKKIKGKWKVSWFGADST